MTCTATDLETKAAAAAGDFEPEQKRYLEGFVAGVQIAKAARGVAGAAAPAAGAAAERAGRSRRRRAEGAGPRRRRGGKLSDPEKFKREQHPFDAYEKLKGQAAANEYPKPPDNFRWRYYGLFYVAPNQNSYMCRLRIPNGILNCVSVRRPRRSRRALSAAATRM